MKLSIIKHTWVGLICFMSFCASAQVLPAKRELAEEYRYRQGKPYTEEKYFKHGLLDSVYRKLDAKGRKVTEGYYVKGQRHGLWIEWLTEHNLEDYITSTYDHGVLKKMYECNLIAPVSDSIKFSERYYTLEPDEKNFTVHLILWGNKSKRKKKRRKKNEEYIVVRNNEMVHTKRKVWAKGIPWKEEEKKNLYDKNGKNLGAKKHGHWRLWNEDGTLQKETWYHMGKKLREKLYDHGKLISDKKY